MNYSEIIVCSNLIAGNGILTALSCGHKVYREMTVLSEIESRNNSEKN